VAALDDLRVVDFSHVIAGPFCTMLLGDHGANVIKVERPKTGDHIRAWSPQGEGIAAGYLTFNRNKRSIAIDLKTPRGRELGRQLAATADVVVESLRPGSADQLGIGYEQIHALNPRAVYCSISGYGQNGPKAPLGGYDLIAQAYGGLMSVTGESGGPAMRAGYSVIDVFAGMAAYGAIMTALVERHHTGVGQHVETSLLDSVVANMSYHATGYLASGKIPGRLGTASPSLVPYQMFEASDVPFILGCNNDRAFGRLCTALDRAELATDSRFATNALRLQHKPVLIELLAEIFRGRTALEWVDLLNAHQVPSSRINTVADVVHDEQVAARRLMQPIPHPTIPTLRVPAAPFRTVGGVDAVATPPPALGEHTDVVLRELGYSNDEIQALRVSGAIG
jgi:crotonobetainyl-CoA:carnitine CoA-transferase CaiB-like acyl-CoA transferase